MIEIISHLIILIPIDLVLYYVINSHTESDCETGKIREIINFSPLKLIYNIYFLIIFIIVNNPHDSIIL